MVRVDSDTWTNNFKKEITETELNQMSFMQISSLIKKDPVTCARYFEHRFRQLFYKVIRNENGPFRHNKVIDYYWRVEFQHRGSPHIHMIIWVEGAPTFKISSPNNEVTQFIDKYISCQKENSYGSSKTSLQCHKHTKSCKKFQGGMSYCRYSFPRPPLNKTLILAPLEEALDKDTLKFHIDNFRKIVDEINEITKKPAALSFEKFLQSLELTEEQYISALRSSIKRNTVFLKRSLEESFVNNYNEELLELHNANMDIQFILDPYACVSYIINYINKSNYK